MLSWLLNQRVPSVEGFWASVVADDELLAAQLLLPECTSVLRRTVFTGNLSPQSGAEALALALGIQWSLVTDERQFPRAFDLAATFQHKKAYDMQYLAVAEITGSTLVTRDRGMRHAANQNAVPVRFRA